MYCTNCRTEVPEGAQFCQNCGAAISRPGPAQRPRVGMRRRLVLIAVGAAGAAAIAVAVGVFAILQPLGGGGPEDSGQAGQAELIATPSPVPTATTTPPAPIGRATGELRLPGSEPATLDPACATDTGSAGYIVEIFSGLVSFDRDLNLIPDIAESWEVSEVGTVYTFHLRSNVLFHDGSRQVTASDFKFSMERSLARALSTVGIVYLDDIVGAREFARAGAGEVSGIEVVNDFTLRITINAPKSYFLAKLTHPAAYVVDRFQVADSTCFQGGEWTQEPNGTGPFKLVAWDPGQRIVLESNEEYYLDPKPLLARVTFLLTDGPAITMYENDEVDVGEVGSSDIERVRDPNEPLNAEFAEAPSMDTFFIGFNTREPPFNDLRVRQAFAMAIDKEVLAGVVLKDLVIPARGILPPGMPGFNEDLQGLPFNPTAARDLLDAAGGPGILSEAVLLTSSRTASMGPTQEAVIAMWEENLGVTITVRHEEPSGFLHDLDAGNFDLFSLDWVARYPDPHGLLDVNFQSQSANNETGYSNPQVDSLLEQARTETGEQARHRLYQQAEELIVQDAPRIPLFHSKKNALIKPYVRGFLLSPFVIESLRYVSIEQE